MTEDQDFASAKDSFISHLVELRNRIMKASAGVLLVFGILFLVWPGPGAIYDFMAQPMLAALPAGSKMIATGVITPFAILLPVSGQGQLARGKMGLLMRSAPRSQPGRLDHAQKSAPLNHQRGAAYLDLSRCGGAAANQPARA